MVRLGQIVNGTTCKMWLVKDMEILRTEGKETCYAVLGLYDDGWGHMFNGCLKDCRKYIKEKCLRK